MFQADPHHPSFRQKEPLSLRKIPAQLLAHLKSVGKLFKGVSHDNTESARERSLKSPSDFELTIFGEAAVIEAERASDREEQH